MKKNHLNPLQAELLCAYMEIKDNQIPIYDLIGDETLYYIPKQRNERIPKKVTIKELANILGTSPSSVQKWRIGERSIPPVFIQQIEQILKIPEGQLEYKDDFIHSIYKVKCKIFTDLRRLEPRSLFVLNENFDAYLDIERVSWDFFCTFQRLSEENKIKVKNELYGMKTNIEMQLNLIDRISLYTKIKRIGNEKYTRFNDGLEDENRNDFRKNQIRKLIKKINKTSELNCELFLSQLEHNIYNVDEEGWDVLIAFMLLGRLINSSSEQQETIIKLVNELAST